MIKKILIAVFFAMLTLAEAQVKTVFVAPIGNPINRATNGTGTSWENAYINLLAALETPMTGYTELRVYVKEGEYLRNDGGKEGYGSNGGGISTLPNGVNVYVEGSHNALARGTDITTYDFEKHLTNFISAAALFQMDAKDGDLSVKGINVYEPAARGIAEGGFFTASDKSNAVASFKDIKLIIRKPVNDDPGVGLFHATQQSKNMKLSLDNVTVTGAIESGAITMWAGADNATIDIKNSHFANNEITIARGGAINMVSWNNTLTIDNTIFYANTTLTRDGGAIFLSQGSKATITNSTFKENGSSGLSASGTGGAIYMEANTQLTSTNNVYACNFVGTESPGGGAIQVGSNAVFNSTGDTFVGNYKTIPGSVIAGGGAIRIMGGTATITGATFKDNYTNYYGGAIFAKDATLTINNSKFENNKVTNNLGKGGAVHADNTILTVSGDSVADSWFRGNSSSDEGGAIYMGGDRVYRISNTGFYENRSGASNDRNYNGGGALFFTGNRSGVYIDGSDFFNNSAWVNTTDTNGGGAIKIDGANLTTEDNITSFTNNRFAGNSVNGSTTTGHGDGGSDIKFYFASVSSKVGTGTTMQLLDSLINYPITEYPDKEGMLFNGNTTITIPTFPTVDITCDTYKIDEVGKYILIANDDFFDNITQSNGSQVYPLIEPGTTSTISILANDQYDYVANDGGTPIKATWKDADLNNVKITIIAPDSKGKVTLDPTTGLVSVAADAKPGEYWIGYKITDNRDSNVFDYAYVYVLVPGPTVCYEDANTGVAGLATNHGITSLQRAGEDKDNWPMVRTSAWTVLESKTKGFVITRMTTAQINDIAQPQEGMMTYDTDEKCLKLYSDGEWSCFSTQTCP